MDNGEAVVLQSVNDRQLLDVAELLEAIADIQGRRPYCRRIAWHVISLQKFTVAIHERVPSKQQVQSAAYAEDVRDHAHRLAVQR